jgi:hypothetical protein
MATNHEVGSSILSGRTITSTERRSRTKFLSFVPFVSTGSNQTAHMEALIEERHRLSVCALVCRFLPPDKACGEKSHLLEHLPDWGYCDVLARHIW